jgi:hypothetical protein
MAMAMAKLPPLFDGITDEELASEGMEQAEIVSKINALRMKQLEGGGLTDDEVRDGIRLNVELRRIRAGGKKVESELPQVLQEKLEDLF